MHRNALLFCAALLALAACNAESETIPDGGEADADASDTHVSDTADSGTDTAECDGPDPSVSCLTTGCADGEVCEVVDGGCAPSHCACDDGDWMCTADCGPAYACTAAPAPCPESPDIGGGCSDVGQECSWGTECCCGTCSPSLVCTCEASGWSCYATDACMIESCAGRACTDNDDCEGGGVATTCVDGVCVRDATPDGFVVGPRVEIRTDCGPFASDGYTLNAADVRDDTLHLSLSFGGGCAEHLFRVCWDGSFMESAPVQAALVLQHEANDDPCDAWLSADLEVPLSSLRAAYADAYRSDTGTVVLRVGEETVRFDFDACTGVPLPACPPPCADGAFAACGEACDPAADVDCGNEIGDGMTCADGMWACSVHPPLGDRCNAICRR